MQRQEIYIFYRPEWVVFDCRMGHAAVSIGWVSVMPWCMPFLSGGVLMVRIERIGKAHTETSHRRVLQDG